MSFRFLILFVAFTGRSVTAGSLDSSTGSMTAEVVTDAAVLPQGPVLSTGAPAVEKPSGVNWFLVAGVLVCPMLCCLAGCCCMKEIFECLVGAASDGGADLASAGGGGFAGPGVVAAVGLGALAAGKAVGKAKHSKSQGVEYHLADTEGGRLAPGVAVSIQGLKGDVSMNGQEGVADVYDARRGRWNVRFSDGKVMAIRPENLLQIEDEVLPAEEDRPGIYELKSNVAVQPSLALGGEQDAVTKLVAGTKVNVIEIFHLADQKRLRARIEQPSGWISIMHTENGFRWADRCEDVQPRTGLRRWF